MFSVYKNEKTLHEKVLGTYHNHSSKVVFIKQFSKKCCLATGQMSQATSKFLYNVGVEMTFEELENCLTDAFRTMSKAPEAVNYAEISETQDQQGNTYRLVLKRSEYDGLLVCKLKSGREIDSFAATEDNPDPEPLANDDAQQPPPDTRTWTECFGKFYVNKNDDWVNLQGRLREFCVQVNHILNVNDEASSLDVVPPTPPRSTSATVDVPPVGPPQVQRQTVGPKATKAGKRAATDTKRGEKKKKKRQQIVSDGEDEVNHRQIIANIITYMVKEGSAVETVLKHSDELNSLLKYDYILFVRANEKEINYIYRMMQRKN